jgi:hypothetical protein
MQWNGTGADSTAERVVLGAPKHDIARHAHTRTATQEVPFESDPKGIRGLAFGV